MCRNGSWEKWSPFVLTDGNLLGGERQFHRKVILSWFTLQPYTSVPPSAIFHAIVRALSEKLHKGHSIKHYSSPRKLSSQRERETERGLLIMIIIMKMMKKKEWRQALISCLIHLSYKGIIHWEPTLVFFFLCACLTKPFKSFLWKREVICY